MRLSGLRQNLTTAGNWFRYFFLLMSIAVLMGAFLGHGFQYALGYEAKYPGWIVSMWGVACLERSSIAFAGERVSERLARIMSVANITELVVFHGLILYFGIFRLVEAHAAYGLIVIAVPLHYRVYRDTGSEASRLVLLGVAIAASALLVEAFDLGFGVWFNYHDVSHVILTVSTLLYYRAARMMTRRAAREAPARSSASSASTA